MTVHSGGAPVSPQTVRAFLLTLSSHDVRGRFQITLIAATSEGAALKVTVDDFRPLFFIPRHARIGAATPGVERRSLPLRSMDGMDVDCLYFSTYGALRECAARLRSEGIPVFESDVHPAERFLMERLVRGGFEAHGVVSGSPRLQEMRNPRIRGADVLVDFSLMSLDIETNARTGQLYSIACAGEREVVFVIGPGPDEELVRYCASEAHLLEAFFGHLRREDPDILIGWNVVGFDLTTLQQRCESLGISLAIGRDGPGRILRSEAGEGHSIARVPGRLVLDVPVLLRTYHRPFEEYSLDFVSSRMLGKHKAIDKKGPDKIREIDRMFAEDKKALAVYNLRDAELTKEVFLVADLLGVIVERSRLCGQLPDRVGGSVSAFDHLYLPLLHRRGRVAIDTADIAPPPSPLMGGYVMEPTPGLFENVLVFDFRSLYPSIMTTFMIDPLARISPSTDRIQGPTGPSFSRDEAILPSIIESLLTARAEAKKRGNTALSQAIKILMNSFYGVLGTTGCRFFSWDLAQTITGTGQYLFRETCAHIESATGYRVIYGDTDSLFVLLGKGREDIASGAGPSIAAETTDWLAQELGRRFSVNSTLVLQFETHFRHFFMPSLRGTSQGSKKRYCGAVQEGNDIRLTFKGLESARSDWTALAKEFQHELYFRVFRGQPVEEYVLNTVNQVRAGALDAKLVYRKRIRKALGDYTVNVPPHVQAARQLDMASGAVSYVITRDGPQPVERVASPIDYNHYVEAQLKPIADSILGWVGTSFDFILSGQRDLFAT